MRLRVCWAPRMNVCQSGSAASAASTSARIGGAGLGRSEQQRRVRRPQPLGDRARLRFVDRRVREHRARALEQSGQPLGAGEAGRAQAAAQRLERAAGDERPAPCRSARRPPRAISRPAGWVGMTRSRRRSSPALGSPASRTTMNGGAADQIADPAQLGGARRRQPAALGRLRRGDVGAVAEQRRRQARQRPPGRQRRNRDGRPARRWRRPPAVTWPGEGSGGHVLRRRATRGRRTPRCRRPRSRARGGRPSRRSGPAPRPRRAGPDPRGPCRSASRKASPRRRRPPRSARGSASNPAPRSRRSSICSWWPAASTIARTADLTPARA